MLDVKDKPIIEHIIKKIEAADEVDTIYVVTNNKFFTHFLDWNAGFECSKPVTIVNDKTMSNDDRLGSLGDIRFVVENMQIEDDVMVIAGDNLFEFSLEPMVDLFRQKGRSVVALYDVKDIELAKLYGIVSIDEESKISDFEEKPDQPRSTLSSTGIYVYPQKTIQELIVFTKNHDADKAGNFLEWLYNKEEVYCYVSDKNWFDIGSLEQLEKARKEFTP